MRSRLILLAYALLSAGITISPGMLRDAAGQVAPGTWLGLGLVLAALLASIVAACVPPAPAAPEGTAAARTALLILAGLQCCLLLLMRPSHYRTYPEHDPWLLGFNAGVVALFALCLSYQWPGMPWPRLRFALVVLTAGGLGAWVLLAADLYPSIDVWLLQQEGCAYLLRGENPYDGRYRHRYGDRIHDFVAPELLAGDNIRSYPYPPTCLLLTVPGYLAGDIRWTYLAALMGTALFLAGAGRRCGLPPGHAVELAVVVFLTQPHVLLVLESGWTEPVLALFVAAALWALAGQRDGAASFLLLLAAAMKQYGVLLLPGSYASGRLRWRPLLAASLVVGLVWAPFLLWDPTAFWRGIVGFHVHSPFRTDSLSVPAVVAVARGYRVPAPVGFAAAGAVAVLLLWRQARCLSAGLLGGAAVLLTFFVCSKAAHLNYYWLIGTLLLLALVAALAEDLAPAPPTSPPRA